MKSAIFLSMLAGSAVAFAPSSKKQAARSTSLQAFEEEIGAQPPLGYWDPLGLLNDADEDRFNRLRYVEIKHGRVAMLAVLGHIVTTGGVRLPGDIDLHGTSFASIPSGLEGLAAVPSAGLLQMFFFIGLLELAVMKDITGTGEVSQPVMTAMLVEKGIFCADVSSSVSVTPTLIRLNKYTH
jgi:hypothetical protein